MCAYVDNTYNLHLYYFIVMYCGIISHILVIKLVNNNNVTQRLIKTIINIFTYVSVRITNIYMLYRQDNMHGYIIFITNFK